MAVAKVAGLLRRPWQSGARSAADILPELSLGLETLRAHTLRSVLTMLGMIFGVAAVIAMLSIGAGAQQQVIAFIEQLGVRNVIVEAKQITDEQTLQAVRRLSPGLSFRDLRAIRASLPGLGASSARKRIVPRTLIPRAQGDPPTLYGVEPAYARLAGLRAARGRFFDEAEEARAAPVAVLGEAAARSLFGADDPVGRHLKVNQQWFRVVGVAAPQLAAQIDVGGLPAQDRNNLIYVPLRAALLRLEELRSDTRNEIDGIYLQMAPDADVAEAGRIVQGLLDASHRGAADFSVIVPAELLAEQQRARRIFQVVMVAIASISLLVGGIGIMNIMLASVLERTREIGIRRAVGARRRDVVRQFLVETTLITVTGGVVGIVLGVVLSRLVGYFAGWSTIVTVSSVALAFAVSVAVGLVFGLYPAVHASRLDPVVALHYE
ncbi:MAG TPA: ABC transporter permease [Vicinamibacterales bacterium]|jgi:putative ABC transport system permease protein|nr:ABC transporter permease [Vicinamibacterales bacterium]